jgi:energy-coupling factor transporter ATP-binding protein EcfA2
MCDDMALADPLERRRGKFVLVVGPDGSGKSTLAGRLVEWSKGRFVGTQWLHWRPSILPHAGAFLGRSVRDASTPHATEPHGRILSIFVLSYYWLDFLVGGWLKTWVLRRRGDLILMERGWHDIAVDARRYRLQVSPKLVFAMASLLPTPDLIIVLEAPAEVLLDRKQEISASELKRQVAAWRRVPFPPASKVVYLDASLATDQVAKSSAQYI